MLTSLIDEIPRSDDRIAGGDDWHRVSDNTQAAPGFLLDSGCHHLPTHRGQLVSRQFADGQVGLTC